MTPKPLIQLQSSPDLVEQVYERLVDAISQGQLKPGQRITQEELAEQLHVSRQPVLQALRMLKHDGLVLDAPGRGVQVAPLTSALTAQVYELRGTLDALAAKLAAQRRAKLDPALIKAGREAQKSKNLQLLIQADVHFHQALYAASGNPLIEQSARVHWCHIRRAIGAVLQFHDLRQSVWDEHAAIAQAIEQGNSELAQTLVTQHSQEAALFMTRELAVQEQTPILA
jgi:DNA-binding GntR family transcriptional regulator